MIFEAFQHKSHTGSENLTLTHFSNIKFIFRQKCRQPSQKLQSAKWDAKMSPKKFVTDFLWRKKFVTDFLWPKKFVTDFLWPKNLWPIFVTTCEVFVTNLWPKILTGGVFWSQIRVFLCGKRGVLVTKCHKNTPPSFFGQKVVFCDIFVTKKCSINYPPVIFVTKCKSKVLQSVTM